MAHTPVRDAIIKVLGDEGDPHYAPELADKVLAAVREIEPWQRLSGVGLTVVTVTSNGETDFDVRDKSG